MRNTILIASMFITSLFGAACVANGNTDEPEPAEIESAIEIAGEVCPNRKDTITWYEDCTLPGGQSGKRTCSRTTTLYRSLNVNDLNPNAPLCKTTGTDITPTVCGSCQGSLAF